jgi:hypothetical protein
MMRARAALSPAACLDGAHSLAINTSQQSKKPEVLEMRLLIRALFFLCSFQCLIGAVTVRAQVDPTKVLIGTWEGTVAFPTRNARTLIIKSVKPKDDGGWIAEGDYGVPGERFGHMMYDVSIQNGK